MGLMDIPGDLDAYNKYIMARDKKRIDEAMARAIATLGGAIDEINKDIKDGKIGEGRGGEIRKELKLYKDALEQALSDPLKCRDGPLWRTRVLGNASGAIMFRLIKAILDIKE